MTNNVDKYEFNPTKFSGYFPTDVSNLGAPLFATQRPRSKPKYTTRVVYQDAEGEIIQWRVMVEDLGGGFGELEGSFEELHDRFTGFTSSDATNFKGNLDTRFYRTACLPLAPSSTTVSATASFLFAAHSINIYGRLFIASYHDELLWAETSSTNATLAAVSHTLGADIESLNVISIGGNTPRLAVGLTGANAKILNTDGTTAATMHASTATCYGMIQTPTIVPDHPEPILIYAGNSIYTLDKDAAETAAPTQTLTNVPLGGCALGLAKIGGGAYRALWVWPKDNTYMYLSTGVTHPHEDYGRIVSTNLEGDEYHEIPMGLSNGVRFATIINESSVAASNNYRVTYYDGRTLPRDLHWSDNLSPDSDARYRILGLTNNGKEVIVLSVKEEDTTPDSDIFYYRMDAYDIVANSWHIIGYLKGTTATYATVNYITPTISTSSNNLYIPELANIFIVPIPNYGSNTMTNKRQTTGSSAGTITDATAFTLLPAWELPGLEGWPKTVERLIFLGDVDSGGTDAYIRYFIFIPSTTKDYATTITTLSSQDDIPSITVYAGLEGRAHKVDWTDKGFIYKLQVGILASRTAADTKKNVNALPFILEGYCYVGRPQPPIGFLTDVQ